MPASQTLVARSVLIAMLAASCRGPEPLRIAVVGSAGAPLGAVLAVEDVNASGGIDGALLELAVVNEPLDALTKSAIATAESLASNDRVLAVIGHGGSATSLAAAGVYNARSVPQIAPNTSSPLYKQAGPYSFRLVASDEHQAEFIGGVVRSIRPAPRLAVLYVNDDYGRALHRHLSSSLASSGANIVYEGAFIEGDAFSGLVDGFVASIVEAHVDLLIWIGLPAELTTLRPKLKKALPRLRVLGSDGVSFLGNATDLTPFEGDWLVAYADVNGTPQLRALAARFRPMAGRDMTDGAALTYDAVGLIAAALRSGARSRNDIRDYLRGMADRNVVYEGLTGPIVFDENGDARPSYVLLEVTRNGVRKRR